MQHAELTESIVGGAFKVHSTFGPGFIESMYLNSLALELRDRGLHLELKKRVQVVNATVLVETKAVRSIVPAHEVQLVHYLSATMIDIGLLLNFGGDHLQMKRKYRVYKPSAASRCVAHTGDGDVTPTESESA
jgi:GxxExxY protein